MTNLSKWLIDTMLAKANAREREAFMGAVAYCESLPEPDWDAEQGWQQYRCRDDTDWKVIDTMLAGDNS